MKKPEEISTWNLPDCNQEVDGYYLKDIPSNHQDNIAYIIKKHNELVELINLLADKMGVEFEDNQ